MDEPRVVVLAYPVPDKVQCPRCFGGREDASYLQTRGEFSTPALLIRHLRAKHPGDTVTYECSVCKYRGITAYPLKNVTAHYAKEHSAPGNEPGANSGTQSSQNRQSTARDGQPTQSGGSARPQRVRRGSTASGDPPRRSTRRPLTQRASPTPSPSAAAGSPTYAAVTAAPPSRPASISPLTAGARGTAAGRPIASSARDPTPPPGRPASSKRPLLSLRRPPRTTPPSSSERGGDERRAPVRTPPPITSAGGAVRRVPRRPPAEETAAKSARVLPDPPSTLAAGGRGGTGRTRHRLPGTSVTPPSSSRAVGAPIEKSGAKQRTPPARPTIGEASRGRHGAKDRPGVPRKSGTPPEATLRKQGPSTSRETGGEPHRRSVACQTPPSTAPRSPTGEAAGPVTPPAATATSAVAATITTTTVTTTVCGGPIMSVGLPPVSRGTPPPSLATPPANGDSPSVVVRARRSHTPRQLPSRAVEQRPVSGDVVCLSSDSEGDTGGPWRTRLSRSRRKRRRIVSGGSSGDERAITPATAARAVPVTPPAALASSVFEDIPLAVRRGEVTPPRREEGGDSGQRTGESSAAHSNAFVDVRGVMGRRRSPRTVVQAVAEDGAPADRADPGRRGANQRRPRRAPAALEQAPRRQPVTAAVERQRRQERLAQRDALVERAAAVETIADLEEFAVVVANFFGEDAAPPAGGEAPGAGDRPRGAHRPRGRRQAEAAAVERDGAGGEAPADPQFDQGERRGNWVREATRIQALYRRNRRKAVREILQGPADSCQVRRQQVHRYFERLYCGERRPDNAAGDAEPAEPATPEDVARLTAPFAEREVDRRLRRMTNSAPGPDGITYRDLRGADPGARLLAALYNICARLETVPSSWKTSSTILVHKKGDRADLENWRPLALGDTTPKLFAALVADRLTDWAIDREKLSPAQKGFLRDEGCYEHNFVLQEILTDARRRRRQAIVAWLDLSNAFGSVPHETIRRAFVRSGVPRRVIEIWRAMYDNCTTRVRTVDGPTAPIPIRSGVRQGCPLSPIAFDLAIDSVLRAATAVEAGYELNGVKWAVMAYADDIALVSDTPEGMQRLLTAVEDEALSVGLRFNPAKCATLHIGAGHGGRVLPTGFTIQGQPMPSLAGGEPYRHLGVPTGFSVDQTPYSTIRGLLEDLGKVNRSLLTPWQRAEVVATFLLPRLDFLLRGAAVEKGPLKAADKQIRRYAKSWLNLPQRASAEVVYLPPRWGGCGLLPLADLADVLTVAHAFRILTARDAAVRDLAWASLRGVVGRRVGHAPDCDEIASFLSGSLEGRMRGGGELSFWSRVRSAGRRQSDRLSVRWKWVRETEEMTVACRGARDTTVVVPPEARAQVVTRLRSAVAHYYFRTLVRKPDQGKVFEVSSRASVSNHFVRGGSFTRFADWRFIHRARLDVVPLNGSRRWGEGDRRCRRCGGAAETLPHVINHCGVHSAAIQLRHDAVLHRLWRACRLPGEVRVNQRVEGVQGELGELRPDLVVRHELSKSVVICDVTIPFENRMESFDEARARKVAKYSALAEELHRQGYRVAVTAFVVGALGSWDPRNEAVIAMLRIGSKYAHLMRRLMVSDTIRWSRDIYVEHVSGVRQYRAPPPPAEDGALAEPPQAVRQRWPAEQRGEDHGATRVLCVRME